MPGLIYIGPDPAVVGVVPLPESWPAEEHDEPDEALAAEKLASGKYRLRTTADDAPPPTAAAGNVPTNAPGGATAPPAADAVAVGQDSAPDAAPAGAAPQEAE